MTYLLAPVASGAYTCGSLFTGIGGIDLAFVRNGFDVRWQVEIEPFCQAVLNKHKQAYWPNAKLYEDVHHVGKANLEPVDVIFGGFPCQDISINGKQEGIKEGTRSGLWIEFARVIGELRPKVILLENVRNILFCDGIRVITDLAILGYDAEWGVLAASDVGAPHERKRWFCVAYPGCQRYFRQGFTSGNNPHGKRDGSLPQQQSNQKFAVPDNREVLGNPFTQGLERIALESVLESGEFAEAGIERVGLSQSVLGRAVNGLSRRLDKDRWPTRPGETQEEWEAPRTISQKQANHNNRLKALGNAVVPQVVEPIAAAIRAYLAATSGANGAGS